MMPAFPIMAQNNALHLTAGDGKLDAGRR